MNNDIVPVSWEELSSNKSSLIAQRCLLGEDSPIESDQVEALYEFVDNLGELS